MIKNMIIVCFLCVAFAVSPVSAQQNEVVNPSFENNVFDSLSEWGDITWSGNVEMAIVPSGRTGKYCAMIASETGGDASWSQRVTVLHEGRYRLSGWIKTQNVEVMDGRGVALNIHGVAARTPALSGTNNWTRLECEFDTNGVTSMQVNCVFGGWGQARGRVWFDDIRLEVVEVYQPESKVITSTVKVLPDVGNSPVSDYIYGQAIEHKGNCIYGGIWAEMLNDRKFYYSVPARGPVWRTTGEGARVLIDSPWTVIGDASRVSMSKEDPYSGQHSLKLELSREPLTICQNELGLVNGKYYSGYIILSANKANAKIDISLKWSERNKVTVPIKRLANGYKKYPFEFHVKGDSDNGSLQITVSGKGSVVIGAVSLMPQDNIKGFRKDTLELLKKLKSPIYRWPGGNFVSGYDWHDGLGPRDKRATRVNPAWPELETNDVGIHEFIEFCQLVETEPMIVVNSGLGDAWSAAAEVEYANGSADTPMGRLRIENGNTRPFDVKWWGIGNEMYGDWELGHMRLEHYVQKHNWIESMMKKSDPSIKTFAVGNLGGDWTQQMLKDCSDNMNFISEHFFCGSRSDLHIHAMQVPQKIRDVCQKYRDYLIIDNELASKNIHLAFDEWNYWYGPHFYGDQGTRSFMKDALGIASGIQEMYRNSDVCSMANYSSAVNAMGCIKTTKTDAFLAASAWPFILYRSEFGTIPLLVEQNGGNIDVAAALTDDRNILTIGIVNSSWDLYKINLDLSNFSTFGKAECFEIKNENPLAYNQAGHKPAIRARKTAPVETNNTINVSPVSITIVRVGVSHGY